MKKIEVLIGPKGEVIAEALGFKGESCKEAMKFLSAALGSVESDDPTPELYEQTQTDQEVSTF